MAMRTDVEGWLDFACQRSIEIVAPFNLELDGHTLHFTALFPQFGAPAGMVVDADWNVIAPHRDMLLAAGYALGRWICILLCQPWRTNGRHF